MPPKPLLKSLMHKKHYIADLTDSFSTTTGTSTPITTSAKQTVDILHKGQSYSVPWVRITQQSIPIKKRLMDSPSNVVRIMNHVAPAVVETFASFLSTNNQYHYPDFRDHGVEIDFHIRVCVLADQFEMLDLFEAAYERYNARLQKYWEGLDQSVRERIVTLVYRDCEIRTGRVMKNALIRAVTDCAASLVRWKKLDDSRAYGQTRLAYNSLMAVATAVDESDVKALWHDTQELFVQIGARYFNVRRAGVKRKQLSAKLANVQIWEVLQWRRSNIKNVPPKELRASEGDVMMHWVTYMLDWWIYGNAREPLFDDLSRNPFGGYDNETAELCGEL